MQLRLLKDQLEELPSALREGISTSTAVGVTRFDTTHRKSSQLSGSLIDRSENEPTCWVGPQRRTIVALYMQVGPGAQTCNRNLEISDIC